PSIYREVTSQGQGSVLGRLHAAGLAQFKEWPDLSKVGTAQGPEQGLKILRSLQDISTGREFADTQALRTRALAGIDQAPSLRKLQDVSKAVQERMQLLTPEAMAKGTRHEGLIDDAKENAKLLKETLARLSEDDLRDAREIREDMRKALANKGDKEITNPKTREELENRIKAITGMLLLVDKNEKLDVGEKLPEMEKRFGNLKRYLTNEHTVYGVTGLKSTPYEKLDKKQLDDFGPFPEGISEAQKVGRLVREYHDLGLSIAQAKKSGRMRLEELFEAVEKPSFSADTLKKWAETDGVILAATIVVSAAAIALTFGGATPLVAAALGAVVATGASEGLKEMQYKAGLRDEGSLIGDYARGKQIEEIDGSKRDMDGLWDVTVPLGTEIGLATVSGYVGSELGGTIGGKVFNYLAARNPAVKEAIRSGDKQIMKLVTESISSGHQLSAKPSLLKFGDLFLKELMSQSGFTVADHLSKGGLELGAKNLGLDVDLNNAIVGTVLNTVLSAAHRGVSMRMSLNQALRNSGTKTSAVEPRTEVRYAVETKAQESDFISDLRARGARVQRTESGFTMRLGDQYVDFVREPAGNTSLKPHDDVKLVRTFGQKDLAPLDCIESLECPTRKAELRELANLLVAKGIAEMQVFDYMQNRRAGDQKNNLRTVREGTEALDKSNDAMAPKLERDVALLLSMGEPSLAEAVRLHHEIEQLEIFVADKAGTAELDAATLEAAQKHHSELMQQMQAIRLQAKDVISRLRLDDAVARATEKAKPLMEAQNKLAELLESRKNQKVSDEEIASAREKVLQERRALHTDAELKGIKLTFAVARDTL
ncbi:MAG: hypothetical protein K2Z81_21745, partial [Cyanobacteria bacterium]|nr:hypothetical protein [Cyanobacteriota bacterium]